MAGQEFELPLKFADLENGDGHFGIEELDERAVSEPEELAKSISQELGFKEVIDIEQEDIFGPLYSLIRNFSNLPATAKVLLVDTLCTNLLLLNPSIHSLVTFTKENTEDGSLEGYAALLQSHRNALKIYVLFLHEICASEEKVAPAAAVEKQAAGPPGGRRRAPSKKNAGSSWDWDMQRPRVIRPLAGALEADLKELYRMDQPEEHLLNLFSRTAFLMLENPAVTRDRDRDLKQDLYKIIALCCSKYKHTVPITASLIHTLLKFEHTPTYLAEAVSLVAAKYDDVQLATAVMRETGRMDPKELLRDSAGAKNVGAFLTELAEKLPKIVARNFSVVMVHMNGEQYLLRSALMTVLGRIVAKAFDEKEENAAAEQARLKSKQALLDVLLERVRDVNSFTRTRVLQTWSYLCEENQVHLGLFNRVTEIAIGRLEDKASNVRRAALQLLSTLIVCNPFASDLRVAPYESTLRTFQEKLDKAEEENRPSDEELLAAAFGPEGTGLRSENKTEETPNGTEPAQNGMEGAQESDIAKEEEPEEQSRNGTSAESDSQEQEPSSQSTQPAQEQGQASLTKLRAMVASLDAAVGFTKHLAKTMPVFDKLLASASVTDVTETIQFLELAKSRKCDDVDDRLRLMLPLIFSQEASVKDAVSSACEKMYVKASEEGVGQRGLADPKLAAKNLVGLAVGASLGTLASLEAIMVDFMHRELITHGMVRALWDIFEGRGEGITAAHSRGALAILTMAAKGNPSIITAKLDSLLQHGLGPKAKEDALLARYTCIALQRISLGDERQKLEATSNVFAALTWLVKSSPLPDESWYSAAEQAVNALYALHPTPEVVCGGLVKEMARATFGTKEQVKHGSGSENERTADDAGDGRKDELREETEGVGNSAKDGSESEKGVEDDPAQNMEGQDKCSNGSGVNSPSGAAEKAQAAGNGAHSPPGFRCSAGALSRFLFVVGHVALKHLVYVESCARDVRRMRVNRDKEAAQAAADRRDAELVGVASQHTQESVEEADKINEELGVGSASADVELDTLSEASEREIIASENLIGHVAPIVARICRSSALLQENPLLRSSALLALCKLMAVDSDFCEKNLQLLFTLVRSAPEESVRCNCIIALGDLAFRFPNLVEPWTEHVYARLRDESALVRKNTVMVLTHLILNDMMKVKGHISEMALCLEDADVRIRDLTKLFFHELSKKGNNPIYNLLPDMLSRLSADAALSQDSFRGILEYMLGFIEKDKQTEGLIEKLCNRFPQTTDVKQWRDIAYCLAQLKFTERGLKKLVDHSKAYQNTLFDDEVVEHFRAIMSKAKKFAKPEMKAAVDEFEKQLTSTHLEKKEDWLAAQKAAERTTRSKGEVDKAGSGPQEGTEADQQDGYKEQSAAAEGAKLSDTELELPDKTEVEESLGEAKRERVRASKRKTASKDRASESLEEGESDTEDEGKKEAHGQEANIVKEEARTDSEEDSNESGEEESPGLCSRKKLEGRKQTVVKKESISESDDGNESEDEEGEREPYNLAGEPRGAEMIVKGRSGRRMLRRGVVKSEKEESDVEDERDEEALVGEQDTPLVEGGVEVELNEIEGDQGGRLEGEEVARKSAKEGSFTAKHSSRNRARVNRTLKEEEEEDWARDENASPSTVGTAARRPQRAAATNRRRVVFDSESEDDSDDENEDAEQAPRAHVTVSARPSKRFSSSSMNQRSPLQPLH